MAVFIDAVGQEHDRFATGNLGQSLHGEIDRIVEHGAVDHRWNVNLRLPNRADARWFGKHMNLAVKAERHQPVVESQATHERVGGIADLGKLKLRGAAYIQHQGHREGLFNRSEVGNLLFDSVLKDAKVFPAQVRKVAPVAIHYDGRDSDETRADPDNAVFVDLAGRSCGSLLSL